MGKNAYNQLEKVCVEWFLVPHPIQKEPIQCIGSFIMFHVKHFNIQSHQS